MPDYLTKEEIKQWRGSLERITLEEFARRLGKEISNEKETNDMVDKVYKHSSETRYVSSEEMPSTKSAYKAERITTLAQQSFDREKELSLEKYERELIKTINKSKTEEKAPAKSVKAAVKAPKTAVKKEVKAVVKSAKAVKTTKNAVKAAAKQEINTSVAQDNQITFKKNLTPREQAVFEHFLNNKNCIVYAKELAEVLDLPRDYVYKYIKNLRAKMNENVIQNADNGGFVLELQ